MKNRLISVFHTAICAAGATNSIYRRAKSDIWPAIPPALCACGMEDIMASKVYFSSQISKERMVDMYKALGVSLAGSVAVKLHSGEEGNQNYLRPEFMKDIIEYVNGTVVECNTAYEGARNTTEKHKKLMSSHGWSKYFDVDIMDADGQMELPVPEGKQIKVNYVGRNLADYDSVLVLSHFKGHPMGGFGGALQSE